MLRNCKACGKPFRFKDRKGMTPFFPEVCSGKCFGEYVDSFPYRDTKDIVLKNVTVNNEIGEYRSSYEIKLAKWLEKNEVPFLYEPMLFTLPSGLKYLPDFYLYRNCIFIETKGLWRGNAKRKFKEFASLYEDDFEVMLMDLESLRTLKR